MTIRTRMPLLVPALALATFVLAMLILAMPVQAVVVYETGFDNLSAGPTLAPPGNPGQDGWLSESAPPGALGEIQASVAHPGLALHEFGPAANGCGSQTIDSRNITPPDLVTTPVVTLRADFFCRSSDLSTMNPYTANLSVNGGPHPGFGIIGFSLGSGNGTPRDEAGIGVSVSRFNGVDNNDPISLTVGQGLTWDQWHTIRLALDQASDTWLYVEVDGQRQDLRGFAPPRDYDGAMWRRGQLMESIVAQIIPCPWDPPDATDDDVYWDNLELTVAPGPDQWAMKGRDMQHTGRADYSVPDTRLGSSFFDIFLWQKPSPGSPTDGPLSSTSMVFFDGVGPDQRDIVAAGYHWPKGVQGMDRHTGGLLWSGLPPRRREHRCAGAGVLERWPHLVRHQRCHGERRVAERPSLDGFFVARRPGGLPAQRRGCAAWRAGNGLAHHRAGRPHLPSQLGGSTACGDGRRGRADPHLGGRDPRRVWARRPGASPA